MVVTSLVLVLSHHVGGLLDGAISRRTSGSVIISVQDSNPVLLGCKLLTRKYGQACHRVYSIGNNIIHRDSLLEQ